MFSSTLIISCYVKFISDGCPINVNTFIKNDLKIQYTDPHTIFKIIFHSERVQVFD